MNEATETEITEEELHGIMDDLDLSWIAEEEQLLNPDNYVVRPLERISISLIYLNTENTEIKREKIHLDVSLSLSPEHTYSILDKTKLSEIVEANRRDYSVYDIQLFHLPLTVDNIQAFSCSEINLKLSKTYLKQISLERKHTNPLMEPNWKLEPTVFLLHDLCELFVFYKQMPPPPAPIKSILKSAFSPQHSITKKVRIQIHSPNEADPTTLSGNHRIRMKYRSTRKLFPTKKGE